MKLARPPDDETSGLLRQREHELSQASAALGAAGVTEYLRWLLASAQVR